MRKLNLSDGILEPVLRKCSNLEFHTTTSEFAIYKLNRFRKGSIWIRPKRGGYRIQTTGLAQRLDISMERMAGRASGDNKPQKYQYWDLVNDSIAENIIREFDRL